MPLYNTSLKHRQSNQDSDEQRRSRRFLGLDFLFVVLLMFFALYFLWPQYFQKQEAYAPISVIDNVAFTLFEIQQEITLTPQDSFPSDELEKSFNETVQQRSRKDDTSLLALLCDVQGNIILASQKDLPDRWPEIKSILLEQAQGTHIFTHEGEASLVMFTEIPGQKAILVVMQPFPPLFLNQ